MDGEDEVDESNQRVLMLPVCLVTLFIFMSTNASIYIHVHECLDIIYLCVCVVRPIMWVWCFMTFY